MKVADNAHMLEIEGMGGTIYPTLVWDDESLVLADTGFPGQAEAFVRAIASAGRRAEDITHIILTHQDMDHIGCVKDLLELAPSAAVLAHTDEAPYLSGSKTPIKLAALLERYDCLPDERKAWCDRMKEGYANRKIAITQTLSDGEVLPVCGGIEIVHTPGHTPGHICLFLRQSGVLVTGDAINIKDGELSGPNPQHTYDMELALKSAEKARAFPVRAVVAYHGGYLELKA